MQILLVNTFDKGGAANACIRLHEGLLKREINSNLLLRKKTNTGIVKSHQFPLSAKYRLLDNRKKRSPHWLLKKLGYNIYTTHSQQKYLNSRAKGLEYFSFPNSKFDITKSELYKSADLVNLHWVAEFMDYSSFFAQNKKPVIWTLHDMAAFSGGNHFAEQFFGIDENGYPVNRTISKLEKDILNKNLELKQKSLRDVKNLKIVAPSEWLANQARQSSVLGHFPVSVIPYGINSNIFKLQDQAEARKHFNIPQNKIVLMFVADSLRNQRKGFALLQRAADKIRNREVLLCAVGSNTANSGSLVNYLGLGRLTTQEQMSKAYAAADLFIIPSLEDNLPNTVVESLMCGTPVLGFPIGGVPDMVQNEINGLLCDEISVNSLLRTIEKFLEVKNFDRSKIAEQAKLKYDENIQAIKYIDLYTKSLLSH